MTWLTKSRRVEELEREMEAPDFWDNAEESQKKMKELKSLKDDMETYQNLVSQMEDMETMIEMGYEENDPDLIPEIQEMLDQFKTDFDNIRVKTLLSGEYDSENAIIKLNAGAGGTEACDWWRHAVPYVQPLGGAQGLQHGGPGLSGRRGGGRQVRDFPGKRRERLRLSQVRERRTPSGKDLSL